MINNNNEKEYEIYEKQCHLKDLFSRGTIDDATQTEIMKILLSASEQYLAQLRSNTLSWVGIFDSEQFEDLSVKHPWLFPYRVLLESDFEIDGYYLLAMSEELETMNDSNPLKLWIEQLVSSKETLVALLKLDFMLSEDARLFCLKYPALGDLQSTKWSKIQQEEVCLKSKELIKKVWCNSALRQKVLELSLPLELADELEGMNLTSPKDLSDQQITGLCREFTQHERKKFEKWCLKERQCPGSRNRRDDEEKIRNELTDNLLQVDERVKACRRKNTTEIDFVTEIEEINRMMGLPQLEDWSSDRSRKLDSSYEFTSYLNFIQDLINETKSVFNSAPPPFDTDEDLVAGIDNGAALRGLYINEQAGENVLLATERLLKKPDVCVVQSQNSTMTSHIFYFKMLADALTFTRSIVKNSSPLSKLNSVDALKDTNEKSHSIVAVNVFICPVATFCFEEGKINLSTEALSRLQKCQDPEAAEKFLCDFGSHVSCGPITLGGILYHWVKVSASVPQSLESLKVYADCLLEAIQRRGYCRYSSEKIISDNENLQSDLLSGKVKVDIEFESIFGPQVKHPKWFEESLKRNLSLCRIIGRSCTPESLIPVWEIVWKQYAHLEPEGRLLEKTIRLKTMQQTVSFNETTPQTMGYLELHQRANDSRGNHWNEYEQKRPFSEDQAMMNSKVMSSADRDKEPLLETYEHQENAPTMFPNNRLHNNSDMELCQGKNPSVASSVTKDIRSHASEDTILLSEIETVVMNDKSRSKCGEVTPEKREYIKTEFFRNAKTTKGTKTKPYSHFLIDRPVDSEKAVGDQSKHHFMNCLRYRLRLPSSDCSKMPAQSLYDTLLRLIDDYDAAGSLEIFRLLLERRSAIPLFIPDSGRQHLDVLRYVSLPGSDIKLGEDKSLMRVAVVSCRKRSESTTPYLLKELFHIDSVHCTDYENDCITSNEVTAEIGCGFLVSEKQGERAQSVLVSHVVGDFLPLWSFVVKFADYVIVEDDPDQQRNFYNVVQIAVGSKRLVDDINYIVDERDREQAIPYLLLWKPSLNNKSCVILPKEQYGFSHLFVECQPGTPACTRLKPQLFTALKNQEQLNRLLPDRNCLHELTILEEFHFEAVKCMPPVYIENKIELAARTPLGEIKTSKMTLQLNYIKQAQYEDVKNEYRLNEAKIREAERKISECLQWRRSKAGEVAKEPLLQLFLQLLDHKETHDRVLSIRKLEQILAKRSAFELSLLQKVIEKTYASYMERSASGAIPLATNDTTLNELKKNWNSARNEYNHKVLNVEHLWREISHVYTSTPVKQRPGIIAKTPHFGAQHLLDGFSIELLDGDANMIHLDWITDVLRDVAQLIGKRNKERIFVLSVMGIQSSGKST